MNIREIVNFDICDEKIISLLPKEDSIFYIHKPDEEDRGIYIEWLFVDIRKDAYSANNSNSIEGYIQVDIFSNIDNLEKFFELQSTIEEVLEAKDYRHNDEYEDYENDTKLYRHSFRYRKSILK